MIKNKKYSRKIIFILYFVLFLIKNKKQKIPSDYRKINIDLG